MHAARPLNLVDKVQVAADRNALMYARIAEHHGVAHVFTPELTDLEAWYIALGGRFTSQPAGPGTVAWTLHTDTDHGRGAPVRVHTLALDTDQIDADCADAVA